MSKCFRCNISIKPASLAITVQNQTYHPTCITCGKCQTPIWGKPFKREKNGMITCEKPCAPVTKILPNLTSSNKTFSNQKDSRPLSARDDDTSKLKIQSELLNNDTLINFKKYCKVCYKSLLNKRFITYENGDIICFECNEILINANKRPSRSTFVSCSVCQKTVENFKTIAESNGDIICENCNLNGNYRCKKCNLLFNLNLNDKITLVKGKSYHIKCFDCSNCSVNIGRDFYYLKNETSEPVCVNCYELARSPICLICNNFISKDQIVLVDNKPLHSQCLRCINCNEVLNHLEKGLSFIVDKNGQYICYNCNFLNNSTRCGKCMGLIDRNENRQESGVSFGFNDYHVKCFKCDQCELNLTKMNKTYTDNNDQGLLFCEKCFAQNYLSKCFKCLHPIMPQSPGFLYDDNIYHKECLLCARCKKSLANKKFYKSGNLLVCDSCF